eukprot:scaffold3886_cov82-Isochrysis_galbana.AAC.1
MPPPQIHAAHPPPVSPRGRLGGRALGATARVRAAGPHAAGLAIGLERTGGEPSAGRTAVMPERV